MSTSVVPSPLDEVVTFFTGAPSREEIAGFQLSKKAQGHVRALLDKNSSGSLTDVEARELDKIMVLNEIVSLIRVRAQAAVSSSTASISLAGA